MNSWNEKISQTNAKGAALAQEVFYGAKTVTALGVEDYFINNYMEEAFLSDL